MMKIATKSGRLNDPRITRDGAGWRVVGSTVLYKTWLDAFEAASDAEEKDARRRMMESLKAKS